MSTVSSSFGGFPVPLMIVMRVANAFRREFAAELATEEWVSRVDAAPPMYAVLRAAEHLDGPSQRDIANAIMFDPSDLVAVLDRMQRNGWVTRERDAADRRRSVVRITDEGREYLALYNAAATRAGERLMTGLDDAERALFCELGLRMLEGAGEQLGHVLRGSATSL